MVFDSLPDPLNNGIVNNVRVGGGESSEVVGGVVNSVNEKGCHCKDFFGVGVLRLKATRP